MKTRTDNYSKEFLKENMMGPNAVLILEELCNKINLKEGMRVLDLGCGKGLTSIFLAKEFGVKVFAADLWITATENYNRFKELNLDEKIVPIHCDAHELPFAESYFDALISVDSYHYFGDVPGFVDKHAAPFVKSGGTIAIAVPGLKKDFNNEIPQELKPFWQPDWHFYSKEWWAKLWWNSQKVKDISTFNIECHTQAWKEWLETDNPYAISDREWIKAEDGKYIDTVGIIGTVK